MKTRMRNHQFGIQFVVFWPIYNLAIPIVSHVLSKYDISVNWSFVIFTFWGCVSRMLITKKRLDADIWNFHKSIETSESTSVQYFRYLCCIVVIILSVKVLAVTFGTPDILPIQWWSYAHTVFCTDVVDYVLFDFFMKLCIHFTL